MYRQRTNLTPHVDFIVLVVAFLGFKFLDTRLMAVLIFLFLLHHAAIRVVESKGEPRS